MYSIQYILYIIYLIQQTTILNARRQCSDVKLDHIQPSFDPLHLYKTLLVLVCIIVHCSLYTLWNQAKYVALNLKLENGYKFLQSSLDDTRFIFHIYKKTLHVITLFCIWKWLTVTLYIQLSVQLYVQWFFSCFRTRIVYFAFWTFLHQSKNVPTFLEFVHEHVINNIILSSIKPRIAVNLNL